jgi:hypothetical protein
LPGIGFGQAPTVMVPAIHMTAFQPLPIAHAKLFLRTVAWFATLAGLGTFACNSCQSEHKASECYFG